MTITVTEYVDDVNIRESAARRLIARNLKIVTGTIVWAASACGGSAGDSFDYSDYGDNYLWMGFSPRPGGGTVASNSESGYVPEYDPVNKLIYLFRSGGDGKPLELCGNTDEPGPNSGLTVQFILLVVDSPNSGVGLS